MKRHLLLITGLVLATFACQALSPQAKPTENLPISRPQLSIPATEADVSRIEVHEAKAAIDSGQSILVDVRNAQSYALSHATGAISIPLENFETSIDKLSLEKDQWIITYCTWPNEHTSARAAFLMMNNGYETVQALLGGLASWADAGYPIEP